MPRDSTETRAKLIRAAEHLFARRGLDVPARDIQELAGQRNASALTYHFGSKRELLLAILDKHGLSSTPRTLASAPALARGRGGIEALVRRFTDQLATDEGRDFMRIAAQLVVRAPVRQRLSAEPDHPWVAGLQTEVSLIRERTPGLPARIVTERAVAGLAFITMQVADRARMLDDDPRHVQLDDDEFIANLVDMTVAALTAPPTGLSKRRRTAAPASAG